jgi:hypothetical protein
LAKSKPTGKRKPDRPCRCCGKPIQQPGDFIERAAEERTICQECRRPATERAEREKRRQEAAQEPQEGQD